MAATVHAHLGLSGFTTVSNSATGSKRSQSSQVVRFIADLIEDLRQRPLQAAEFAKHDMFREHINAMSISYFALILLLLLGCLPVLQFLVKY